MICPSIPPFWGKKDSLINHLTCPQSPSVSQVGARRQAPPSLTVGLECLLSLRSHAMCVNKLAGVDLVTASSSLHIVRLPLIEGIWSWPSTSKLTGLHDCCLPAIRCSTKLPNMEGRKWQAPCPGLFQHSVGSLYSESIFQLVTWHQAASAASFAQDCNGPHTSGWQIVDRSTSITKAPCLCSFLQCDSGLSS